MAMAKVPKMVDADALPVMTLFQFVKRFPPLPFTRRVPAFVLLPYHRGEPWALSLSILVLTVPSLNIISFGSPRLKVKTNSA